jgi:putative peptide zinc metalloprotease protein
MRGAFFSHSWHRVAATRPRLKAHAKIHPQRFRGETWYVLQDPQSGRFHRLSAAANLVVCLMDGRRSVQTIWDAVGTRLGPAQPTQDEIIQLLSRLHAADLLAGDVPADLSELVRRGNRIARGELIGRLRNPIAVRLPLFDPDRFLASTLPLAGPFFSPAGFLLWLAAVATGLVLAALHADILAADIADRALLPSNIVLMLLVYPVLKGFHELGHGWATKRGGGEVHELGIMLLVLVPVPYVDASDAAGFPSKWQRAVVGGAGMMVELLLASLAMILWVLIEPGLVRAIAFNVMLVAGVSTVLFNGNPLLRFDGYYILADLIEIPNLGPRANQYLGYFTKRWLLGIKDARSPVSANGERAWFIIYGISSFFYRLALTLLISLYLAGKAFLLGVILAIMAIVAALFLPLWRGLRYLVTSPELRERRGRAGAAVALVLVVLTCAVFAVPAPYATVAEGFVWIPENGTVRANAGGSVIRLLADPGSMVKAGQPLVALEDPFLTARIAALTAQREQLGLRLSAAAVSDLVSSEMYRQQLRHVSATLDQARKRLEDLTVRAAASGQLVIPLASDLPGRMVERGMVLGYVLQPGQPIARALVGQDDIDLILRRGLKAEARFAQRPEDVRQAKPFRAVPGAVERLPSPVLGRDGGGPWVESVMDSTRQPRLVQEAFLLDFVVDGPVPAGTIGSRVYLRIDHGREPIAWRVFRALRQLFLRQLDV